MTKLAALFLKRRVLAAGVISAVGIAAIFFAAAAPSLFPKPEVSELSKVSWTLPQYEDYFTRLAKEKGAPYAYAVLIYTKFSSNIDTHIIGHDIGYVYYDQKGIRGITNCAHGLGDACIHAVVTEEFLHEGPGALHSMSDYCLTYSPDSVVYANCFHGIGHGILAYAKYDYVSAISECKAAYEYVLDKDPNAVLRDVYGECVGGATMELEQGKHDADAYAKMKPFYLPADDPLAPCDRSFVPTEVKTACYQYLNGHLIGLAGGNSAGTFPKDEVYKKALGYCKDVPNLDERRTCYGGLGVSFLYQVTESDLRNFALIDDDSMRQTHHWCSLAGDEDSIGACILTAGEVLLSDGEHGTRIPARYCELVSDAVIRDRCYIDLVINARRYLPLLTLDTFCPLLPEPHRSDCYKPR